MFLTACNNVAQQWLIRKKAFKEVANVSVAHAFINYGSQAFAGVFFPLTGVLITIYSLAIAVRSTIAGYIGFKLASGASDDQKTKPLKSIAYEYRDFPLFRAPQMVLYAASQSVPVLMLTLYFGAAAAGYYTLTRSILNIPVSLIGGSVQSVFYPSINDLFLSKKKTKPLIVKAILSLSALGLMPFLLIIIFGPFIFEAVFGQEWQQAGIYAQWVSVWMFFI